MASLLRLPTDVLQELLGSDQLVIAHEDIVFDIVLKLQERTDSGKQYLWSCVRWAYLSANTWRAILEERPPSLDPQTFEGALITRLSHVDRALFRHSESSCLKSRSQSKKLPTRIQKCLKENNAWNLQEGQFIKYCMYAGDGSQFKKGDAFYSDQVMFGPMIVARLKVYPQGAAVDTSIGFSVVFEIVPQPSWPKNWKFENTAYTIVCWGGQVDVVKTDKFTFQQRRDDGGDGTDRGWHDLISWKDMGLYTCDGFLHLGAAVKLDRA